MGNDATPFGSGKRAFRRSLRICLLLASLPAAAGTDETVPEAALELRGKLHAGVSEQRNERFALRATLTPRTATPVDQRASDLRLHGVVRPKGTNVVCFGPGHVFADGYELPP